MGLIQCLAELKPSGKRSISQVSPTAKGRQPLVNWLKYSRAAPRHRQGSVPITRPAAMAQTMAGPRGRPEPLEPRGGCTAAGAGRCATNPIHSAHDAITSFRHTYHKAHKDCAKIGTLANLFAIECFLVTYVSFSFIRLR